MMADEKTYNGHSNEAVKKMEEITENSNQTEFDELYDILQGAFNTYYDSLHDDSPLKAYLEYETRSALDKINDPFLCPVLYADTYGDVECMDGSIIKNNTVVRVTMASGIGDVGVTTNVGASSGHSARVSLESLYKYRSTLHFQKDNPEPHYK